MSDINTDELIYPMMPKGKLVYETKVVAKKAEPKQQQSQKPKREVPNRICYANTAFKDWKPGDKIPTCHVCEGTLFPEENHKCSGFKPKFIEHDETWEQKQDAKRAEIRESDQNRPRKCAVCHAVIRDQDDACHHEEYCCQDLPRGRHWYTDYDPIVGDNDGHECNEDYIEPDYCEGNDDGYDCD